MDGLWDYLGPSVAFLGNPGLFDQNRLESNATTTTPNSHAHKGAKEGESVNEFQGMRRGMVQPRSFDLEGDAPPYKN